MLMAKRMRVDADNVISRLVADPPWTITNEQCAPSSIKVVDPSIPPVQLLEKDSTKHAVEVPFHLLAARDEAIDMDTVIGRIRIKIDFEETVSDTSSVHLQRAIDLLSDARVIVDDVEYPRQDTFGNRGHSDKVQLLFDAVTSSRHDTDRNGIQFLHSFMNPQTPNVINTPKKFGIKVRKEDIDGREFNIYFRVPHTLFHPIKPLDGTDGLLDQENAGNYLLAGKNMKILLSFHDNAKSRLLKNGIAHTPAVAAAGTDTGTRAVLAPLGAEKYHLTISSIQLMYTKIRLSQELLDVQRKKYEQSGLNYPRYELGFVGRNVSAGPEVTLSNLLSGDTTSDKVFFTIMTHAQSENTDSTVTMYTTARTEETRVQNYTLNFNGYDYRPGGQMDIIVGTSLTATQAASQGPLSLPRCLDTDYLPYYTAMDVARTDMMPLALRESDKSINESNFLDYPIHGIELHHPNVTSSRFAIPLAPTNPLAELLLDMKTSDGTKQFIGVKVAKVNVQMREIKGQLSMLVTS